MVGKKLIGLILFCCMAFFYPVPALANQETAFRIDMDNLNLQLGTSGTIIVSLHNAQGAQVVSIEGLDIDLISQSQSSSTNIINRVTTHRVDFTYVVMPKSAGQFTAKAIIEYNGQYYETNTLEVTVSEASQNENVQDLFIKTNLSLTESFLGEKIVLTYELYSRYYIESCTFREAVSIDGALIKELPNSQLNANVVYLDGIRYDRYEVKQFIIDPIKPGVLTIPSFNFQVNVMTDSMSFFRSTTPVYLMTEENNLNVKPLPFEGRPADFSGIVGELNLEGHYSRTEMNYGDSFALYATVSGFCNLDVFNTVSSGNIPGLTVYETQKNSMESVIDHRYYAQKDFELILVPEKTGSIDLPPVMVSYFNPTSAAYETAEIQGLTAIIHGEMPQPNSNNMNSMSNFEPIIINQVNYTDTNDGYFTFRLKKEYLYRFLIALIGIALLIVFISFIKIKNKTYDAALKSLYKQLMKAKEIHEIYDLFNAMMKHCYQCSLKSNSRSAVRESLADISLAEQVVAIMEYMDSAEAKDKKGAVLLKNKIRGVYHILEEKHA